MAITGTKQRLKTLTGPALLPAPIRIASEEFSSSLMLVTRGWQSVVASLCERVLASMQQKTLEQTLAKPNCSQGAPGKAKKAEKTSEANMSRKPKTHQIVVSCSQDAKVKRSWAEGRAETTKTSKQDLIKEEI